MPPSEKFGTAQIPQNSLLAFTLHAAVIACPPLPFRNMELSPQLLAGEEGGTVEPHYSVISVRQPRWAVTCARFILRMSEVLDVMTFGGT
jgi:hypothetical protein